MMEVVVPLRVDAPTAARERRDDSGVVGGALGDEITAPRERAAEVLAALGELLQKGRRRRIEDGVHRVEAQGVDVEVLEPLSSVEAEVVAHVVGSGVVEVERRSP